MMRMPIILRIGIDDGVYALHRYREESAMGAKRVCNACRFAGRAILPATRTTMIGFEGTPRAGGKTTAAASALLAAVVGWAALTGAVPPGTSAQEEGARWLQRIEDAERIPFSYGVVKQTITTSSGALRTLTFRSWSAQNGDVALMVYTEPRRVAGDKILQLNGGDDIWYYMKRRDTTRHFAGHTRRQSAMGSDFTYEDLAMGDFTDDYTAQVLGYEEIDGVPTVKLKCTPTPSGPSYDYLILWAGEEDALTRRVEYYDEGELLKTLFITDFREVEGRRTAFRMEMVNHRENSRTVLETVEITYAQEPDPSLFTMAALSRTIPPRRHRQTQYPQERAVPPLRMDSNH